MGSEGYAGVVQPPAEVIHRRRLTRVSPRLSLRHWVFAVSASVVLTWAFLPVALIAIDAARHHRVFLGVAGYYPMDGLQYLAWIRDGHDGLIRNLYGSTPGRAVFVHPIWSISGLAQGATGVSGTAIMLFWKTVGAVVLLLGALRLVRALIPRDRPRARMTALALALFGGLTPICALLALLDSGNAGADLARAAGDLVPVMSLWDYAPLAIALGLMPFALEQVERVVAGTADRRAVFSAAGLGLLIAWLHPWQGQTLITVAVAIALWHVLERRRSRSGLRCPARFVGGLGRSLFLVLGATALPLVYYLVLTRVDPGWMVSEKASVGAAEIPWQVLCCCVAPVAALTAWTFRRWINDSATRGVLLWSLATMLTVALSPSGRYRALDGLAMPLAVLVVRSWPERLRKPWRRLLPALALTAALGPFAFFMVFAVEHLSSHSVTSYVELEPSDLRAVRVAARATGDHPVLAPPELGTAIPALADVSSWVGHPIWTPNYPTRAGLVYLLFRGVLAPDNARKLVLSTGTRAVVEPCGSAAELEPSLQPAGFHEMRLGCARVYLRPG